MASSVDSTLRVGVVHGPGSRITPVWFDLKRRKHAIREITNVWRDRQGETVRIHFHVTDEGALYELVYDLGATCWTLEQKGKGSHVISPAWRPQGVRNVIVQ